MIQLITAGLFVGLYANDWKELGIAMFFIAIASLFDLVFE